MVSQILFFWFLRLNNINKLQAQKVAIFDFLRVHQLWQSGTVLICQLGLFN